MAIVGIVRGKVDAAGRLYVRCGDGFRPVTTSREPIAQTVRNVELCPCGREGCDCDEWHEIAHTSPFEEDKPCPRCLRLSCNCASESFNVDPHGDLTWRDSLEINY